MDEKTRQLMLDLIPASTFAGRGPEVFSSKEVEDNVEEIGVQVKEVVKPKPQRRRFDSFLTSNDPELWRAGACFTNKMGVDPLRLKILHRGFLNYANPGQIEEKAPIDRYFAVMPVGDKVYCGTLKRLSKDEVYFVTKGEEHIRVIGGVFFRENPAYEEPRQKRRA